MQVVFASGVLKEVKDAQTHYESKVPGLGQAFVAIVHTSIQEIKRCPHRSRLLDQNYRRYIIERFSYGIIYRIETDIIHILAVAHFKRRPDYWKLRKTGTLLK
jgi:mRNA-degrading endonuclease RelE of RelBE toxin-antitoxin system